MTDDILRIFASSRFFITCSAYKLGLYTCSIVQKEPAKRKDRENKPDKYITFGPHGVIHNTTEAAALVNYANELYERHQSFPSLNTATAFTSRQSHQYQSDLNTTALPSQQLWQYGYSTNPTASTSEQDYQHDYSTNPIAPLSQQAYPHPYDDNTYATALSQQADPHQTQTNYYASSTDYAAAGPHAQPPPPPNQPAQPPPTDHNWPNEHFPEPNYN